MKEDQNDYPPVNFYFKVIIAGMDEKYAAGFQEVSGLGIEIETEEIVKGGENRFEYKLPSQTKSNNLKLMRGLVADGPFIRWIITSLYSKIKIKIITETVTVLLLNEQGSPLAGWAFYNAYPVAVKVSDLNSTDNKFVIETLELAYTYFEKIETN